MSFSASGEVCARCGVELPRVDGGPAAFCPACGLQQLRVSEGALRITDAVTEPAGAVPAAAKTSLDWPAALRIVLVAAVVGVAGPSTLPGAVVSGGAGGVALLAMPLLTLLALSFYHRSRPRREVTPSIGSRVGATLGLTVGAGIAFVTGVMGFSLRYRYHSHAVDDLIDQATNSMVARVTASGPTPQGFLDFAHSPEFRASSYIFGCVISMLMLAAAGTVCGWFAGSLLRARRERFTQ